MIVEDVSSNEIAPDEKSRDVETREALTPDPINIDIINELQLRIDQADKDDIREINKILVDILNYPQEHIAEIHRRSMMLGNYDLESQAPKVAKARMDTSSEMLESSEKKEYCPCCGFIKQTNSISICTSFDGIKNMGLSTYLFFSTFKNLTILLVIMIVVYSFFALYTNFLAAATANLNFSTATYTEVIVAISLTYKQAFNTDTNKMYYFVSCWLGVAMIIIWIIALVGIKYKEAKDSQQYDRDTISCSDYSIVVEGLPMDTKREDLQKQLDQYFQTTIKNNSRLPAVWKQQPLTIAKFNVGKPFYLNQESLKDEEMEQIQKQIQETKEQIIGFILERQDFPNFKLPKDQREAVYVKYVKLQQKKVEKCLELQKKIRTMLKNESSHEATTAFITFETNNAKTVMAFINEKGLLNRLRSLCSDEHRRFTFNQGGQQINLDISRAPEPEDIIWSNIGHRDCSVYGRKFFTFTITAVLLGISFAIVYGLTKAQESAKNSSTLSLAISATIAIINPILGVVINFLTAFEKDYTASYREGSLAVKSIVAQMINTIVIPVVTAYEIKEDVYSSSGLVNNVFYLGVSTAVVPPIMMLINPYNIFMKILRCIKSRPSSKLYQNQKEHNLLHEGIQFEIGYSYIYTANTFMFVCFYVSLQPIVSLFALLGFFLMYWVQKYCIFNRYRRPVPGTDFVNNAVWRVLFLGAVVYSFGSMTWSNLAPNGIPREAILPNLVALGIALFLFILPMNTIIIGTCFSDNYEKVKKYQDERIFFPSEYDRLNPSTQQEGIAEYNSYVAKKVEEIKNASQEKQMEFASIINQNAQRAQMNQMAINPHMGGAFANIFGMQAQPAQYRPQPMMPNFISNFMPIIPGYQPNYRPMPSQQRFVVTGGRVHVQGAGPVNTYPQYQHQPRPVFGPNQAVPAPAPAAQYSGYGGQQMLQHPPPGMHQSNPMAMMNLSPNINVNNNPLHGFGFMNQNSRSRRF